MQTSSHRTTLALDRATAARLKRLAGVWKVSRAEVVRRAVAQAEAQATPRIGDPIARLRHLHDSGQGLTSEAAAAYLAEVREERKLWRWPG
ncbi:MAG: ribbon-helix-helix protein, CopG family [Verrucomicrobiales bacterium]|nr:ribbon-helix-helix protein, CopG family [Verrucomicrobiales bacterium]